MTTVKQHDTVPWSFTATDGAAAVDLTAALSMRLLGSRAGVTVIDAAVTGDAAGVVTYSPAAADVAAAGTIQFELEVTWPDGSIQTFPRDGYVPVTLVPDIPPLP